MQARTLLALIVVTVLSVACRQDMHDQPRYEPLEASTLFADGAASRTPVEGTVARGQLFADRAYYTGLDAEGQLLTKLPEPVTRELLERGRTRFDAFCSPCHGRTADGRGMVVQRGFKQPESFHQPRLRQSPVGYYFDVMTRGFGEMSSYAAQISPRDRWAVTAYIRTLQVSQYTPALQLTDEDRNNLAALAEPGTETTETDASHE